MQSSKQILKAVSKDLHREQSTIKPKNAKCPRCRDTGWTIAEQDGIERALKCECRRQRAAEAVAAKLDEQFRSATFATFKPKSEGQAKALKAMQSNPFGCFFLTGPYRVGKTHLMVSQFRQVALEKAADMRTSWELMNEFRQAELQQDFSSPVLMKADCLREYHLFWDDLDKMRTTPFRDEMVFSLVDCLYRAQHGLTVTSNLGIQELVDSGTILPAVARRIDDMCEVIQL